MMVNPSRSKIKSAAALAVLSALLFANVLCVAPVLHGKIHGPPSTHDCVVTLIASGNYEVSDAPVVVSGSQPFVEFAADVPLTSLSLPTLFLSASVFEHAPPALS